ncbi:NACHT domain-containing protein [Microbispora sp. ZYX-F-249]|uniref:NACHT domain-containing protein n=1 Tax=Microbispora maris TaxID=3144104 RepID=A0ABV0ATB3_9ACTN
MGGDRWRGRFSAGACVLLLIVAGLVLWRGVQTAKFEFGDVDPASLVVGLVALALAVWAGWQSAQAQRVGDTDTVAWADRLAQAVLVAETRQRDQLLGDAGRTIDVAFTPRPAPAHNARGAMPHGALADVTGYFGDLCPQRLVITGPPGAGKTVLAVELILGMLERRKPGGPVPVRISAAGWNPDDGMQSWLVAHLMRTFQMQERAAVALVEAYQVIAVIDGLDEMDSADEPGYGSRAGRALRVLNRYQQGRDKARLVLTCRTGQYQALTAGQVWARDAARIELGPVTPAQAGTFIEAAAGTDQLTRWQPVLHALNHPGHPLAGALATPWRLTLAVTVYQQRHPATGAYLRDPADLTTGHGTTEQIGAHLLDLFIDSATAAATAAGRNPRGYRPDRVRAWLTELAVYLTSNATRPLVAGRSLSSTDLVLHELWPLAGDRPRTLTRLLAAVVLLALTPLAAALHSRPLSLIVLLVIGGGLIAAWRDHPWPDPANIDLTQLKTRRGRWNSPFGWRSGSRAGSRSRPGSGSRAGSGSRSGSRPGSWRGSKLPV